MYIVDIHLVSLAFARETTVFNSTIVSVSPPRVVRHYKEMTAPSGMNFLRMAYAMMRIVSVTITPFFRAIIGNIEKEIMGNYEKSGSRMA